MPSTVIRLQSSSKLVVYLPCTGMKKNDKKPTQKSLYLRHCVYAHIRAIIICCKEDCKRRLYVQFFFIPRCFLFHISRFLSHMYMTLFLLFVARKKKRKWKKKAQRVESKIYTYFLCWHASCAHSYVKNECREVECRWEWEVKMKLKKKI